jgi:hypothetical protein
MPRGAPGHLRRTAHRPGVLAGGAGVAVRTHLPRSQVLGRDGVRAGKGVRWRQDFSAGS